MTQVHKRFTAEQVKVLFQGYAKEIFLGQTLKKCSELVRPAFSLF